MGVYGHAGSTQAGTRAARVAHNDTKSEKLFDLQAPTLTTVEAVFVRNPYTFCANPEQAQIDQKSARGRHAGSTRGARGACAPRDLVATWF